MKKITSDYDFELEKLVENIRKEGIKKILLQFPDGLRHYAVQVSSVIRKETSTDVFIAGDSSFGACDLALNEAETLGVGLLVHFGHNEYHLQQPSTNHRRIKIIYVPVRSTLKIPSELIDELVDDFKRRGIENPLLTATIQHVHLLPFIRKKLSDKGLTPHLYRIGKMEPGQVIGCDYSIIKKNEDKIDSVIVLSGGIFHPLGASLTTDKPVFQIDPYAQKIHDYTKEREKWLKKRYSVIYKAKDTKTWGLWIGAKSGQYRPLLITHLEKLMNKKGILYHKIISQYTTIAELRNLDTKEIEAHVITSCPRIPIDDITLHKYEKPVLTPGEAIMILKEEYEKYRFPW